MVNFGTNLSTGEGWAGIGILILTVFKALGWIPADMTEAALVAAIAMVVNFAIFFFRKVFRKGSVPFVADPPL